MITSTHRPARPTVPARALNRPGPAVVVSGVSKGYAGRRVLDDLDLTVEEGEILGLLGTNGAGKTTTVEIIQGLRHRDAGEVRVLGVDPAHDRSSMRQLVGAQLQTAALPDRLRVDEALRLFTRLAGDVVDWREVRESWGLTAIGGTAYGALSGGQRQRLFVALALVNRPRLVVLDEVTQGLDPAAREQTWRLVERVRDEGATIVVVTHDMDEAERRCDRVAVLRDGRVRALDTPRALAERLAGPMSISFSVAAPTDASGLERVREVRAVQLEDRRVTLEVAAVDVVRVVGELDRRGLAPTDLSILRPSLHDAFLVLTGGAS